MLAGCIIIFIVSLLKERGVAVRGNCGKAAHCPLGSLVCVYCHYFFLPIQVMVQHLFTRTSDIIIHKEEAAMIHEFVSWLLLLCVTL